MRVTFRCDASASIGLGHLRRCIEIARCLESEIVFATEKDPTNRHIHDASFEVMNKDNKESEEDFVARAMETSTPDVLVIDKKYEYTPEFLQHIKRSGIKIVIIDSLQGAVSVADLLILPIAHLDENAIQSVSSPHIASGPQYVIIRREIHELKKRINREDRTDLVVTTGGSDPRGVLLHLAALLEEINPEGHVILLCGSEFKRKQELEELKKSLPANFSVRDYSTEHLKKAKACICTFGVSIYEMAYLGIPTICVAHDQENDKSAQILSSRHKSIAYAGYFEDINAMDLSNRLTKLLTDTAYYKSVEEDYERMIDGKGAQRIAELITQLK